MSSYQSYHEKRKHPRVANNIPVKICTEQGDIVTETGNISRSGVYCKVEKYIEPMTKMKVHLLLPVKKNGKSSSKKISCQGVVVRTEPIQGKDDFNVAIFFNDISQRDAETIADYINNFLEEQSIQK
jgi:hypothetical protein